MDFNLSDNQAKLQESARRMLGAKFSNQMMREAEASSEGYSREIWEEGIRLGWPGIFVSEEFGGGGCGLLDACVLHEELGRAGATVPLVASSGISKTILECSPKGVHRDQCLKNIASGKVIAPALIDEQGRNEWDEVRLPINAEGSDYRLSGKKILVPFASTADELLVTTVTPDGEMMIVVVDSTLKGVSIVRHQSKTGIPLSSVEFDDVLVPGSTVIQRGKGARSALDAGLQAGCLLTMAEAVGMCEVLIKIATEYVSNHKAFGQAIGTFQAVSHPCADMRVDTDTIRILMREAAWLVDVGRNATEEVWGTKALANELFERVGNNAFRVHGATAYSNEYDLELYHRRVQAFCHTLGEKQESFDRAAQAIGI